MPDSIIRFLVFGSSITACIAAFTACTTSGLVPFGAKIPNQVVISQPGSPASAEVGTSGAAASRVDEAAASARSDPLLR